MPYQRRSGAIATYAALTLAIVSAREGAALASGGAANDAYDDIGKDRPVDVHALLDLYAQHDFNMAPEEAPDLHAFELRDDQLALNFARLTLAHRPGLFGFRIDAGVGDTPAAYYRSDPATLRYSDASRGFSYVEQAFVTYVAPAGRGLAVDIGKFGTPVGFEENETPTNWNYTRGLLFTLAEPTYHSGARATYPLTDDLALSAFWLNGWNTNVLEGTTMRSYAAAASWNATKKLELSGTYAGGLERAPRRLSDPTLTFRHVFAGTAVFALLSQLRFATTLDYGHDERDGGATWWGVGGYVRAEPREWLAATLRGEAFADPQAFMTGTRQRIAGATATVEVRGETRKVFLIGRVELRRDQSDTRVFATQSPPFSTRQDTLTFSMSATY